MNKNYLPLLALVAAIVIGGLAYWYSTQTTSGDAAPVVTPAPVLSTSTSATGGTAATPGAALPEVPPNLPAGTHVTGRTVWQGKTGDDWKLAFSVQTTWKYNDIPTADGKHLSQATGGDDTTTFFVSRNLRINEPSGLTYATKTRTIAGKSVTVHIYTAPKAGSAFYEFFSIPVGSDTYYFRIQSAVASTKVADDFISLIILK